MRYPLRHLFTALSVALCMGGADTWAQSAEAYPSRPVRLVLPIPAGGTSDLAARLLAQSLSAAWSQPVIVENKPGAGGAIAAQMVQAAPADGYTLLWTLSSMAGIPFVQKGSPYQNLNEFTPVSTVVKIAYGLFVNNTVPAQSLAELTELARAQPDRLAYGTGTLGEYMYGAATFKAMGARVLRVPYNGGAQLMKDLVAGDLQINIGPLLTGLPQVQAGKLRILATYLPQRSPLLPQVPTMVESGVLTRDQPSWNGLMAPAHAPADVMAKIAADVVKALRQPAVREKLEQGGAAPMGGTPREMADEVDAATVAWKTFARDYGIRPE